MDSQRISDLYREHFGTNGDGLSRNAVEHVMQLVARESEENALKSHDRPQPAYRRSSGGALVYVAVPYLYSIAGASIDSWHYACDPRGNNRREIVRPAGAYLARNFNAALCACLNDRDMGYTHFCMLHADVIPRTPWWLDVLVAEQQRSGADLLHVVLPIKTYHGLTSTAIEHPETGRHRRLTMHEIGAIGPLTFDAETAGFPGWRLLASTGFWIIDLRKPWVNELWPRQYDPSKSWQDFPCFEVRDRIFQKPNGEYLYETGCEDWRFSRKFHSLGLKVMGTRAVVCGHLGEIEYANDKSWGTIREDSDQPNLAWAD